MYTVRVNNDAVTVTNIVSYIMECIQIAVIVAYIKIVTRCTHVVIQQLVFEIHVNIHVHALVTGFSLCKRTVAGFVENPSGSPFHCQWYFLATVLNSRIFCFFRSDIV